jgi:hypothetical protein
MEYVPCKLGVFPWCIYIIFLEEEISNIAYNLRSNTKKKLMLFLNSLKINIAFKIIIRCMID